MAKHILQEYLKANMSRLKIYEVGAGNGTLCRTILDFIEQQCPEVYSRSSYHIIEISKTMSDKQKHALSNTRHFIEGHVQLHNCSILDWNRLEEDGCFIVACEVLVLGRRSFYLPSANLNLRTILRLIKSCGQATVFFMRRTCAPTLRVVYGKKPAQSTIR